MYYKDTKIRKIIGIINLFPNFVTLIVETNTVTRMKDLIITAVIKVYQYDELNEADQALVKTAKDTTARSYSPYSHFSVGAAALLGNGIVVTGTNQENAAYPSGLCAERTTLFYAISYGGISMLQQYHTKLKGTLALTDSYLTEKALQREKGLYKFIWVRNGSITVEIDHQEMVLVKDEVISLTHLQHLEFKSIDGEYLTLLFNSNFYCIYGNDHEVSCSGFLFNGSSHLIRFMLNEQERKELDTITEALENEFTVTDSLQEEMLRILLKRFIIQCTRIARNRMNITREKESGFEIVRQYYNLVDEHFRTKKQVQDYADMLHKSPKTLSNIFSTCKLPSPLRVIHERVEAEAKRLLLYSNKSAKEIADILGFEDQASFSRFFKNISGQSAVQFRNTQEGKN